MPGSFSINKQSGDYIIACDGGLNNIKDIKPDILLGDFDSLSEGELKEFNDKNTDIPVKTYPVRKDETDSEIAADLATGRGYKNIVFFGCAGGSRPDHTFANISVLSKLSKQGIKAIMKDGDTSYTCITNGEIVVSGRDGDNISVFAFGREAVGVSISGLSYEVNGVNLSPDRPLGVSNSFVGKNGKICVSLGTLLIIGKYIII